MSIKNILIPQARPKVMTPYEELSSKFGVNFEFKPFYTIEPLSSIEMRAQRCNPLDYSAVVFSSRSTIDAFFHICEQLRVKIPETMKYFCTNEKVAMYLQKHIVYRKRKIFYGDGTPSSVLELITAKHKDENFLIVTTDIPTSSLTKAFDATEFKHQGVIFAKSTPVDLSAVKIDDYQMIVIYNKNDVKSLKQNFPEYRQGDTAIVAYGSESLRTAISEAGLEISISGPTSTCTSAVAAIGNYLKSETSAVKGSVPGKGSVRKK